MACSLYFYSYWNISYLPLILGSILFNYLIGTTLARLLPLKIPWAKKGILIFGVCVNLLLLGDYKYANFFMSNVASIFGGGYSSLKLALPLGISFFTFTQIAFLVDSYRSEAKEYDLLNYALFVTFFPHLIAGPIVYHKDLIPQFQKMKSKVLNYKHIALGLFIFSIGLFKKGIIADTFAI